MTLSLSETDVDRIARRVVDLLDAFRGSSSEPRELVDAAEAARILGVTRSTVYELADELGAQKIGNGSKPRLRFDAELVAAYGATRTPKAVAPARAPRRKRPASAVALLPVRMSTPISPELRRQPTLQGEAAAPARPPGPAGAVPLDKQPQPKGVPNATR